MSKTKSFRKQPRSRGNRARGIGFDNKGKGSSPAVTAIVQRVMLAVAMVFFGLTCVAPAAQRCYKERHKYNHGKHIFATMGTTERVMPSTMDEHNTFEDWVAQNISTNDNSKKTRRSHPIRVPKGLVLPKNPNRGTELEDETKMPMRTWARFFASKESVTLKFNDARGFGVFKTRHHPKKQANVILVGSLKPDECVDGSTMQLRAGAKPWGSLGPYLWSMLGADLR
jgi:hypothetical protein